MKTIKFVGPGVLLLSVMFIFASCEKDEQADGMNKDVYTMLKDGSATTPLLAGQYIPVGNVIVTDVSGMVTVEYLLDANGWRLEGTHLDAKASWVDIPQTKKGNPKVGHFEYKETFDPSVQSYAITLDEIWSGCFDIAAHAEVVYDPLWEVEDVLPDAATLIVNHPGSISYFRSEIHDGGALNGLDYVGWCIDVGHSISPGISYGVTIYSSYEDVSGIDRIDNPENLDKVNWVINQGFVGQESTECGVFSIGDVQRAIWELIEETPHDIGNMCRINEILDAANLNGGGFIPGCGDLIAVIVVPDNINAQVTIIEVEFAAWVDECEGSDETAWAEGTDFPGKNWAMHFEYCVPE